MKPRHLMLSWAAYWTGLVALTLGPAVAPLIQATSRTDGKGSVSLGFGEGLWKLAITVEGRTLWSGVATSLAIGLWIAVPPLVIWLGWVFVSSRRRAIPAKDNGSHLLQENASFMPGAARQTERSDRESR